MKKFLMMLCIAAATTSLQAATYDDVIKAASTGDVGTMVELLKKGVDVDTTDIEGNTLLMLAARDGSEPMVNLLISQRPKINFRNSAGDTAIRLAAFGGHLEVVKKLVAAGAYVNSPGWTPLIYAAFAGHVAVVKFLIDSGADVNAASENGSTALIVASRNSHVEVVKLLLAAKADVNRTNESGVSALDMALRTNNTAIAELLKAKGAKPGDTK